MSFDKLKERNLGTSEYVQVDAGEYPKTGWAEFKQVVKRTLSVELFKGLGITFKIMKEALWKDQMATVQYPIE